MWAPCLGSLFSLSTSRTSTQYLLRDPVNGFSTISWFLHQSSLDSNSKLDIGHKYKKPKTSTIQSKMITCIFPIIRLITTHSKKFKMNEEVDSPLSEKVSNLLLTWKWMPTPNCIPGQETLRSNFKKESPSSMGIPVLRVCRKGFKGIYLGDSFQAYM